MSRLAPCPCKQLQTCIMSTTCIVPLQTIANLHHVQTCSMSLQTATNLHHVYNLQRVPSNSCQLASCPDLLHVLANSYNLHHVYKLASCPFKQLPTCIMSRLAPCPCKQLQTCIMSTTCIVSLQTATNLHHVYNL